MIILLDCDDVLTQFTQGVLDELNRLQGEGTFDISDCTSWDMSHCLGVSNNAIFGIAGREGFCENLYMMPGAQEGVEELKKLGEVYVLTSPIFTSRTWVFERTRWLYEHFGISGTNVIHANAKHLVRGDVFIDDRISHINKWTAVNGRQGIHFRVHWRTDEDEALVHPSVWVGDWTGVVATVKNMGRS